MKEVVLQESESGNYRVTTQVNMCDICSEQESEHYCYMCNRWICDIHSVKVDIEIDDDWIPYVCTECYDTGDYIMTLKLIQEVVQHSYTLKSHTLEQWKKAINKTEKNKMEKNGEGGQQI